MKKILMFAALLAAMVSCGTKQTDPFEKALIESIKQSVGQEGKVKVYSMEKIDSTTFRTEMERKFKIFNLRIDQNRKFYETYIKEGKSRNAALKSDAIKKDQAILEGLETIQESLSDRLDEVAYYDYKFSAGGNFETSKAEFRDYFCAITPSGEVLAISPDQNAIYKGTASVIPGYKELLDCAGGEE